MDEKGYRLACPTREEVIVLIGIKEMYVRIPKNRLSVTVIECISVDDTAISPLVIVPSTYIISSWFSEQMTSHEVVSILLSGYTNEGICM